MTRFRSARRIPAVLGACVAVVLAGMGSARADALESSPTLPLLGIPYTIPGGSCFPGVSGVCVTGGEFTLTSLTGPGFVQNGLNEDITTNATATIDLNAGGPLTLTGTIAQVVLGRQNPSDQDTWVADLTSVALAGTLNTYGVTMILNPGD
jgi:hypothetical protein